MTDFPGISNARRVSDPIPWVNSIVPNDSDRNSFMKDSPCGRGNVS